MTRVQQPALIFRDCFKTSLILMAIFWILSLISCAIPSEIDKYRGSKLESAVQSDEYRWWLLVTVITTIPSALTRVIEIWPLLRKGKIIFENGRISRSLKIFVIIAPNLTMYFLFESSLAYDSAILAQLQNSFFYSQTLTIIGCIFCSTFGHKYPSISSTNNHLDFSVEKSSATFLFTFTAYKLFLLLSVLDPEINSSFALLIISTLLLITAMLIMLFVSIKLFIFLTQKMRGFNFSEYDQMHDFYRIIGVLAYSSYTFGIYVSTNQLSSNHASYELGSSSLVQFLVGQVLLVVYLTVVDQECLLFEAHLKGEQLQTRLNLMRYISHEMRSPLNTSFLGLQILRGSIDGVVTSIKRNKATIRKSKVAVGPEIQQSMSKLADEVEDLKETTDLIKESSCIALETLNDMLTFDKIDENKLVLELEDLDVWTFVSETVRPFRLNAVKEQVTLSTECVDLESNWVSSYYIKADRFKLNQVLRNFVSNAMKFCPKGTGSVHVLVERRSVISPHEMFRTTSAVVSESHGLETVARISVKDNGCGISPANQKKLFGQYVQFNASQLQQGQGSGLGLWISKNLVELHGGAIGAFSMGEGLGTTFYFELPLYERERIIEPSNADGAIDSRRTQPGSDSPAPDITDQPEKSNADDVIPKRFSLQRLYRKISPAKTYAPSTLSPSQEEKVKCNEGDNYLDNSGSAGKQFGLSTSSMENTVNGSRIDSIRRSLDISHECATTTSFGSFECQMVEGDAAAFRARESRRKSVIGHVENNSDNMSAMEKVDEEDEDSNANKVQSTRSFRVLIVDDTVSTRKITNKLLTQMGHRVEEASDGLVFLRKIGVRNRSFPSTANDSNGGKGDPSSAAGVAADASILSSISSNQFDFVLMDDNMPNMCGPDATAAARAAGYSGLIFGLTGNTHSTLLDSFVAKGADVVFTKPLDVDKLQEAIKTKLAGQTYLQETTCEN